MARLNSTPRRWFALWSLLSAVLVPALLFAQPRMVSGSVTDEKGTPLSNVSVSIKNAGGGTLTDTTGKFSLRVSPSTVLVFSSVDYNAAEVTVGNQLSLSVTLNAKAGKMDEIVVVGYGQQKKVNLVGSVATISADDLAGRPVTNVSSSLAGLAPGVFVRQGSGKPGNDGAAIRIRGIGTLNDASPLVVIDGIIGSMDAVNPDDIQSLSILKDAASASIYGSQAANGVILVTTKKGSRSKTTVTYNGFLSGTAPINKVDFVSDYATHMRLINEGYTNLGQAAQYPAARIAEWQAAKASPDALNANGVANRLAYPNTDWYDVLFTNRTAQNHNVSVSGGSEKLLFLLSGNYLNNPGVMNNTGTERYLFRANLEVKINRAITIGTQTFASHQLYGMANTASAFQFLNQTSPGLVPYYNGKYGYPSAPEESATSNNIYATLDATGGNDKASRFNSTVYTTINFFKGVSFESRFNYQTRFSERNSYTNPIDRYDFATGLLRTQASTPNLLTTNYSFAKDYMVTIDQVLRYNRTIGNDHEIGALAGYNEFYSNAYDFNASKLGLIDYNITTLGSAGISSNQAGGDETDFSGRYFFGRVNYAYKQKYLFEATLRRDGSSRFSPDYRWGTFPSVGAGWKISEEGFFARFRNTVQYLKIRGSWGRLGNNVTQFSGITNQYAWQAVYTGASYSFNGVAATSLNRSRIANPLLQWETTTQTDLALEATVLRNFNIELGFYNRLTDGILTQPAINLVFGTASAPLQNTATVLNRGIELKLGWNKRVKDFTFSVGGNFSYNYNEVTKYKGPLVEGFQDINGVKTFVSNYGAVSNNANNNPIIEGHSIQELYIKTLYKGNGNYKNGDGSVNINGGPRTGMIRTAEDLQWVKDMLAAGYKFAPVSSAVTGTNKALLNYGDFIYADNNGDGIYGSTFDRKFIGTNSVPRYNFGVTLDFSYKNFDLSMLWAGSSGFKYLWIQQGYNSTAIRNGFHILERIANDHFYFNEANTADPANNLNGLYPRLKNNTDNQNLESSDFWLYDASYTKLKNMQIGYTIPQRITSRASISRARIYLTGENLLMFTKYPGQDPEVGNTIDYPTLRQMALGLTITF